MQFIPSGMLLMGDVQGVQLSAFCMGSTEVTLAEWRSCTAPGCTTPNTGGACNFGVVGRDSHPVNCVDWLQARAYCQWRGGDLATEAPVGVRGSWRRRPFVSVG
ncbi:MAG: SUMF1/EgtB/PvdO family nonheme iron enzyme [Deltaproteobacteria bacterium]|nr:SUMF1/EgtB/PvdO family nonheme iron enzyme [Deltaproteobacteria bacterium]